MKSIVTRLTYANVVSTLALFLVLGGATAFAAAQLGKNSVGAKQLKANAVTASKIKAGAVDADKLAAGAVSRDKIAAGAIGAKQLADGLIPAAAPSVPAPAATPPAPSSQIVAKVRGTAKVPFKDKDLYPLSGATYTQAAGEDDVFLGEFQVTFSAACVQRRIAHAVLLVDSTGAGEVSEIAGSATIEDGGQGEVTRTAQFIVLNPGGGMSRVAPAAPTPHTFSIRMGSVNCQDAARNQVAGATMTGAKIDVIGTK